TCCTGSGAGSCTGCAISQCTGSGTDSCCTGSGTESCVFATSQCTGSGTDSCCTGSGTGSCLADHCEGATNAGSCCTMYAGCAGGGTQPCTAGKQHSSGAFGGGAARTITENGVPAGAIATGDPPASETIVSVFCVPPTFSGAVDGTGDLPGPGAASLKGQVQL